MNMPGMMADTNKKRTDYNDATAPWHGGEKEKTDTKIYVFTPYCLAPQSAKT